MDNTGVSFVNSKNTGFTLYSLDVMSGEVVTLGTNGQSTGCINYTVFAVEATDKAISGDVNADGKFDIADIVMMQNGCFVPVSLQTGRLAISMKTEL